MPWAWTPIASRLVLPRDARPAAASTQVPLPPRRDRSRHGGRRVAGVRRGALSRQSPVRARRGKCRSPQAGQARGDGAALSAKPARRSAAPCALRRDLARAPARGPRARVDQKCLYRRKLNQARRSEHVKSIGHDLRNIVLLLLIGMSEITDLNDCAVVAVDGTCFVVLC